MNIEFDTSTQLWQTNARQVVSRQFMAVTVTLRQSDGVKFIFIRRTKVRLGG